MSLTLPAIEEARSRIRPYIVQTPLLRLPALDPFLGCQTYVKLETLQVTGSFKLRGALNMALSLSPEDLSRGLVAASSGNHGKAVAYAAKLLGTKAAIVMPETAPRIKVEAIRALGAEVVSCPVSQRFVIAQKLSEERGAALLPPYNDERIMAGQGTAGLEIAEQKPDLDAVVIPVSGGGLIGGVSTALRAVAPTVSIYGAEPASLPRYTASLQAGHPVTVEQRPTLADALVSQRPGDVCFPAVQQNVDAILDVDDRFLLKGQKLLISEGKLLAEPSSCIGLGAVLQGAVRFAPGQKVCFLISGGSVGLEQLRILEEIEI